VKRLRQLHHRRHREERQEFLIDGLRLVEAALEAQAPVVQLLVATDARGGHRRLDALLRTAQARGIPVRPAARRVLEAISQVETPQAVVAVVRCVPAVLLPLLDRSDLLLLIVDRVADPGNLGTIIRTADAAAATAVVLLPGTVDVYNPKVVRATMGSLFHLPVVDHPAEPLRAALRTRGVRLLATDSTGTVEFQEADYRRPAALVVGNEAEGVHPAWREAADAVIRIPLYGRAESLNVAVAAALVLYAAARPVYTDANLRRQA